MSAVVDIDAQRAKDLEARIAENSGLIEQFDAELEQLRTELAQKRPRLVRLQAEKDASDHGLRMRGFVSTHPGSQELLQLSSRVVQIENAISHTESRRRGAAQMFDGDRKRLELLRPSPRGQQLRREIGEHAVAAVRAHQELLTHLASLYHLNAEAIEIGYPPQLRRSFLDIENAVGRLRGAYHAGEVLPLPDGSTEARPQ